MTALPRPFVNLPLAHRGLHDINAGRPENSLAAIKAAIDAGYGVEIDIQCSADKKAMVFHDYELSRLTSGTGPVHQRTASELQKTCLLGSNETIPTLTQVLETVAGKAPILIEIKDQDGALGSNVGALEQAIADDVQNYEGDIAIMSFNPHSVAAMAKFAPDLPRGLVTGSFLSNNWRLLPDAILNTLRQIPDYDRTGSSFISHRVDDLSNDRVSEIRATGAPILCWTVKDKATEVKSRAHADNITFEGYLPSLALP